MYFFINSALNKQNSGIEHAQIQRSRVFKKYHMPYMLLYAKWNPQMYRWLDRFELTQKETLTLFDYYQRTQVVKPQKVRPEDVFMSDGPTELKPIKGQSNVYQVVPGNPIMGRIRWFANWPNNEKQVSMVERFDIYGNLYRVDEYDVRGFMARSQFYTPDNRIYAFVWWDKDGKPVITESFTYGKDNKMLIDDTWEVVDHKGQRNLYSTFEEVVSKWLDDLNNDYYDVKWPNYFVGDRMEGYEDALMHLTRPAIRISHIHNSHAADVHDEMHSLLNNYYEYDLYNSDRYDFYIAATKKQTRDMNERFGLNGRVINIPVGLTKPQKRVPMKDRKFGSVLVTARRAEEKQIEKIIEIVALTHQQVKEASLDVYGYRDSRNHDAAKKKIDAMIKKYDAGSYIHIHDYDPDLDAQRDNHQVYIVFSTMEGFNIALMEAQNHGEAAIANDVNYGPNELVVSDKNGYVVGYDDVKTGAQKLTSMFKHPDKLQALSDGAYELSKRYSAEEIHNGWMELTEKAEQMWKERTRRIKPVQGLEDLPGFNANGQRVEIKKDERLGQVSEITSQSGLNRKNEAESTDEAIQSGTVKAN